MTKVQKVALALALTLGFALVMPLHSWADWGPPTAQCSGSSNVNNCFTSGDKHIACTWECYWNGHTYCPAEVECQEVPGC